MSIDPTNSNSSRDYLILGFAFGCIFPILATAMDLFVQELSISFDHVRMVQSQQPLHWIIDRVVHLIEELSGSHLNPSVVEIFTKTVAPFPIGTNIRILSGSYVGYEGVVADIEDRNLAHPLVRLLFDAQGNRIDAVQLDLGIEEDIQLESVREGAPQIEPLGSSKRVSTMLNQAEAERPIHPMIIANKPICTSCGYENEHSARFCSECGSTLPIPGKCLSCDHVNKPSAKFCSECGHRLAG